MERTILRLADSPTSLSRRLGRRTHRIVACVSRFRWPLERIERRDPISLESANLAHKSPALPADSLVWALSPADTDTRRAQRILWAAGQTCAKLIISLIIVFETARQASGLAEPAAESFVSVNGAERMSIARYSSSSAARFLFAYPIYD